MRQAETALKDGRLDEAFELARSGEVRTHRRGQDLIGRLARALAVRGREHLDAGRLAQASSDCDKAVMLGGNLPEAADLRAAVEDAAAARQERDKRKLDALAAAREHVANGQLSLGGQWLASVDDTYRADALRGQIETRRAEVEVVLAGAREALQHEHWAQAVECLVCVRKLHSTNPGLPELSSQVITRLADRARAALEQGRLDQARMLVQMAEPLSEHSIGLAELRRLLELLDRAAAHIQAGNCRPAVEVLNRAQGVLPSAGWLQQVVAEAEQAAESVERLRGGPLGMLMDVAEPGFKPLIKDAGEPGGPPPGGHQWEQAHRPGDGPAHHKGADGPAHQKGLDSRLMLHVDGVGSFLVLSERCITIGGAAGSRKADVPLLLDSTAGPVSIERKEEDYFLNCDRPVMVNNQPVARKLLVSGDRIALSQRCWMRFEVPNAASTSALLTVSGARMHGTDATRVVLMDRSLVIGPGSWAHVRADRLSAPAVLHVRDGRLFCNSDQEIMVGDRPMDRQVGLPMDTQVRIGPLTMVIRKA